MGQESGQKFAKGYFGEGGGGGGGGGGGDFTPDLPSGLRLRRSQILPRLCQTSGYGSVLE